MESLDILYEDNHLLVVNKPVGIATMGAEQGPTVHSMAADYLKRTYHKPGKAFVGVVSRLDAMTSGVLVLARTSKAASRLSTQFAERSGDGTTKIYLAALDGDLQASQGELTDQVLKDDAAHRMRVVPEWRTPGQGGETPLLPVDCKRVHIGRRGASDDRKKAPDSPAVCRTGPSGPGRSQVRLQDSLFGGDRAPQLEIADHASDQTDATLVSGRSTSLVELATEASVARSGPSAKG